MRRRSLRPYRTKSIAAAGLDVFDVEPLPLDHPFRKMDNVVITPHLGYVSEQNYRKYFPDSSSRTSAPGSTASRCGKSSKRPSSWPGLSRPSASYFTNKRSWLRRHKAGHDGIRDRTALPRYCRQCPHARIRRATPCRGIRQPGRIKRIVRREHHTVPPHRIERAAHWWASYMPEVVTQTFSLRYCDGGFGKFQP